MQNQAVWIIDPDEDDQHLVREIWKELGLSNELVFLRNAQETFEQLDKVDTGPFIILCEINLHKIDGFQLRRQLLETNSKKYKSVPFIYWSTYASDDQITQAFEMSAHGFFIKESNVADMKKTFIDIINYWKKSKMPSKADK